MRIGSLAAQLGTTPHAIRFYERRGLLPGARRTENGYRDYTEGDVQRLRLLIGLRQLDVPLDQAAELATLCADGRCDQVSDELKTMIPLRRAELQRQITELSFLDRRLAHLAGELGDGKEPRPLITFREEDPIADAL